jgi:hypothetical protein
MGLINDELAVSGHRFLREVIGQVHWLGRAAARISRHLVPSQERIFAIMSFGWKPTDDHSTHTMMTTTWLATGSYVVKPAVCY